MMDTRLFFRDLRVLHSLKRVKVKASYFGNELQQLAALYELVQFLYKGRVLIAVKAETKFAEWLT